jgi:hypothetical protein
MSKARSILARESLEPPDLACVIDKLDIYAFECIALDLIAQLSRRRRGDRSWFSAVLHRLWLAKTQPEQVKKDGSVQGRGHDMGAYICSFDSISMLRSRLRVVEGTKQVLERERGIEVKLYRKENSLS